MKEEQFIAEIERLWEVAPDICLEEDILFRQLGEAAEGEALKEYESRLRALLGRTVGRRKKIYLYSFLLEQFGNVDDAVQCIREIRQADGLSPGNKYFLFQQMECKKFYGMYEPNAQAEAEEYFLFREIIEEYRAQISPHKERIPSEERNQNLVLVIITQVLGERHGPTKSAMGRCIALQKMGKNVLLINTAEKNSEVGAVPFYHAKIAEYNGEYLKFDALQWKNAVVPYFQCEQNMPDIETICCLLDMAEKMKPLYAIEIGTASVVASLLNDMIPVFSINMVPSQIGVSVTACSALARDLNESDRKYLQLTGRSEASIVREVFSYDLIEDTGEAITREEIGIEEDDFVLTIVGGRLDSELRDDFLQMLQRLSEREKIKVLILGGFGRQEELKRNYPDLADKVISVGMVQNVFKYLRICNLYVNPERTGGGGSSVEAMAKGIPAVSTPKGDVGVCAGKDFWTESYETMEQLIVRYIYDEQFYREQSRKARERAAYLLDTESAFRELVSKFMELEEIREK